MPSRIDETIAYKGINAFVEFERSGFVSSMMDQTIRVQQSERPGPQYRIATRISTDTVAFEVSAWSASSDAPYSTSIVDLVAQWQTLRPEIDMRFDDAALGFADPICDTFCYIAARMGTWDVTIEPAMTPAVPTPTPVPLPTGAPLILASLGLLGLAARRRKA